MAAAVRLLHSLPLGTGSRISQLKSNVAKAFNCEAAIEGSLDAIQVMGGDGVTPFYPLEQIMSQAKVETYRRWYHGGMSARHLPVGTTTDGL